MAQQNVNEDLASQVSLGNNKDPNATRGASAQVIDKTRSDLELGMKSQMAAKSASQQKVQPFGGNSDDVMTMEDDATQSKNSNYSKIEVIPDVSAEVLVQSHNDTSTVPVPNMSCKETMVKLQNVLGSYKGEIDFSSDEDKLEIAKGLVFIDGFYGVHFGVYVFTDKETKTTRWEFRRLSGDAMASAKFLAQVKTAFFAKEEQTEDDQDAATGLQALPLDTSDMKLDMSEDQKEMMMIHEALLSDELDVELDEAAENYLSSKLVAVGAISKENAVDRKLLVKALMDETVLYHDDVAVQRAALMILAKFTKEFGKEMKEAGLSKMLPMVSKKAEYSSITKRADALSKLLE